MTTIEERNAEAWIARRAETVPLFRKEKVDSADGGYTFNDRASVGDIVVRVIEIDRIQAVAARGQRLSSDGKLVTPSKAMVTMPDTDVQRYDEVDFDGKTWEIVWLSRRPEFRLSAELYCRG